MRSNKDNLPKEKQQYSQLSKIVDVEQSIKTGIRLGIPKEFHDYLREESYKTLKVFEEFYDLAMKSPLACKSLLSKQWESYSPRNDDELKSKYYEVCDIINNTHYKYDKNQGEEFASVIKGIAIDAIPYIKKSIELELKPVQQKITWKNDLEEPKQNSKEAGQNHNNKEIKSNIGILKKYTSSKENVNQNSKF